MGDIDYHYMTILESARYTLTGTFPDYLNFDAISRATPLDTVKAGLRNLQTFDEILADPSMGDFGGRGWEWIGNLIALGGIWLLLRKIMYSISGQTKPEDHYAGQLPKTAKFLDGMTDPDEMPDWLSGEDLEVYVAEFERTGFRGGLNWYRNFDRNWELLAPWQAAKVSVPALFVGGLKDPVVTLGGEGEGPVVAMLPSVCEDLRGKVLIEGAGHWNQQEAPEETNAALLEFLASLDPD